MGFIKKIFGIHDIMEKALISMLKDIQIFSSFPDKKLFELSKKFKLCKYNSGDTIITQGQEYGKIGLLESGELNVLKSYNGQNISLAKIKKGEIFGEMSYFTKAIPMANVIAEGNCILWEATYEDFNTIMVENPEIYNTIKQIIIKRQQENLQIIEQQTLNTNPAIAMPENITTIMLNI